MTTPKNRERVLIAVGGNALFDKERNINVCKEQVQIVCGKIIDVVKQGYQPVMTFGNGPQVGNFLDMVETSARIYGKRITMDVCVSWTQGEIGYLLSQELTRVFQTNNLDENVIAVNTRIEVDPSDPAFENPSKPVGRFLDMEDAEKLFQERGWVIGPDSNRGYRRMVPSPKPMKVLELQALKNLIDAGTITLCGGGGGIPVHMKDDQYVGIEAVIDKDYTSCLLAKDLGIENVIICTEVENVYLNFGEPEQKALRRLSLSEAKQYLDEGHFGKGSMGPKVAALIDYVEHGGKRAFITSLDKVQEALNGDAGTEIYAD